MLTVTLTCLLWSLLCNMILWTSVDSIASVSKADDIYIYNKYIYIYIDTTLRLFIIYNYALTKLASSLYCCSFIIWNDQETHTPPPPPYLLHKLCCQKIVSQSSFNSEMPNVWAPLRIYRLIISLIFIQPWTSSSLNTCNSDLFDLFLQLRYCFG